MWSGERGKAMPDRLTCGNLRAPKITIANKIEIFQPLRVDMNLRPGLPAEIFNLFDNAAFCAMPPVEER